MPATQRKGYINRRLAARVRFTAGRFLTVSEIEQSLGLDKVKPILLTSSEEESNFDIDNEYFKDMYEDELREFLKKI